MMSSSPAEKHIPVEDCTYRWQDVHTGGRMYIPGEDCTYRWQDVHTGGRMYIPGEDYTYRWKDAQPILLETVALRT
jgi:hypothetical protein